MSPRKVRLVIDVVRGMQVARAVSQLRFMKKDAALPVLKLVNSAAANAEHNFHLKTDDLYIRTITADGGPVLHRWAPRAMGRAAPIRKRTTHITVVLAEKGDAGKKPVTKKEEVRVEEPKAKKAPKAKKSVTKAKK